MPSQIHPNRQGQGKRKSRGRGSEIDADPDDWQFREEIRDVPKQKYCETFAKGHKPYPDGWTLEKQTQLEADRLAKAIALWTGIKLLAQAAVEAREDGAREARTRANAVVHRLLQCLGLWTRKFDVTAEIPPSNTDEARRKRLDIEDWYAAWMADLEDRRGRVAASCLEKMLVPEGNKAMNLYTRELGQMEQAAVAHGFTGESEPK